MAAILERLGNIRDSVIIGAGLGTVEALISKSVEKGGQLGLWTTVGLVAVSEGVDDMRVVLDSAIEANRGRFLLSSVKLVLETAIAGASVGLGSGAYSEHPLRNALFGGVTGAVAATFATVIEGKRAAARGRLIKHAFDQIRESIHD